MKLKTGFTLTELLIVLAIIAVVLAILVPVFIQARKKAYASDCTSNIRQLTQALQMYCTEYDDRYPNSGAWDQWYISHPKEKNLVCPAAAPLTHNHPVWGFPGYNINNNLLEDWPDNFNSGVTQSALRYPSATVVLCEQAINENSGLSILADGCLGTSACTGDTGEKGFLRHFGGAHYAFADGHVKWFKPNQVYDTNRGVGNTHPLPFDGSYPTFQVK